MRGAHGAYIHVDVLTRLKHKPFDLFKMHPHQNITSESCYLVLISLFTTTNRACFMLMQTNTPTQNNKYFTIVGTNLTMIYGGNPTTLTGSHDVIDGKRFVEVPYETKVLRHGGTNKLQKTLGQNYHCCN